MVVVMMMNMEIVVMVVMSAEVMVAVEVLKYIGNLNYHFLVENIYLRTF